MHSAIVIGSGPAGISVAKGLLERGCKVTLLDVGNTLEPEKQNLLHKIQKNNRLLTSDTLSLRHHAGVKKKLKLPYGSTFIYDHIQDHFSWNTHQCHFQPSFAQGGLSNSWGGATVVYTAKDLSSWPDTCRDLSIYYSQVISWLGKYYTTDTSSLLSRQAHYLKSIWEKHKHDLEKNGFLFSPASLAIDSENCQLCGLCQYGCPFGLIYNSSIHLESLKLNSDFTYINGVVVENFSEKNEIEIHVKSIKDKQVNRYCADRLFIACGAGLSSLLYLRALNEPGRQLILKDSQHFFLPCLIDSPSKDIVNDPLHTLCQLKLSLSNENISRYPIHLQLYTYMDIYFQEIKNKLKWMYPVVKPVLKSWIERLVVIQGYLDSKESNHLKIQYQNPGKYLVKSISTMPVSSIIYQVVSHLKQHRNELALKPLSFLLMQSLTGQSNHIGGSLPMSDNPQIDEVDCWGRPIQFKRIHFVDGSILPSIPAGPITLTIMANAYRIGKEVPL